MYYRKHSEVNEMSLPRVCAVVGLLFVLALLVVMAAPAIPASDDTSTSHLHSASFATSRTPGGIIATFAPPPRNTTGLR